MKKLLAFFSVILMAGSLYAKEVTLLMDWFPQGNQSGYWQAQFDNEYHDDVKITIKAGGPKVNTTTAVASGQVEFGLNGSDSVMMANAKGAGLKGIFVSLNHVPYSLVFHPNQGIKSVIDAYFINSLLLLAVIPITETEFLAVNLSKLLSSLLLPELEIIMRASFLEMIPKSP